MVRTRTRSPGLPTTVARSFASAVGTAVAGAAIHQYAARNRQSQQASPSQPAAALARLVDRFQGTTAQHAQSTTSSNQLAATREQAMRSMCVNPSPIDLAFDEGQISLFLEALPQIYTESPAAVWAFWDFVAHHYSPSLGKAQARRTMLYTLISPNPGAAISAHISRQTATSHGDDQLTTRLSQLELQYVMIRHGLSSTPISKTSTERALKKLAGRLSSVSDALEQRSSTHRLASARIILADVYLLLERREDANEQMGLAFELAKAFVTDADRQFTSGHIGSSRS